MSEDDAIALSALQHYLYCPRQCALIHVEQLWAESRHTAEGRLLHEKADKPKAERRKGVRTVTAMPLAETRLGITGIADVVEFHQGPQGERAFPVEYKRGRPKAHRADEVQLFEIDELTHLLETQFRVAPRHHGAHPFAEDLFAGLGQAFLHAQLGEQFGGQVGATRTG